jgi:hypothetical protein
MAFGANAGPGLIIGGTKPPAPPESEKPEEVPSGATAIFSCHPTQNYSIGAFHFTKGTLEFTGDEEAPGTLEDFRSLLLQLPLTERLAIREVSAAAAEQLIADHKVFGGATKSFDSSLGRAALEQLHRNNSLVGTEDVAGQAE